MGLRHLTKLFRSKHDSAPRGAPLFPLSEVTVDKENTSRANLASVDTPERPQKKRISLLNNEEAEIAEKKSKKRNKKKSPLL